MVSDQTRRLKVYPPQTTELVPLHGEVIGSLPRPSWLVGGDLLDPIWTVRIDDPTKRRSAEHIVRFDVVLAPGGVTSTHPDYVHDLVTAKLLVYHAQKPAYLGGVTDSSAFTPVIAREYFRFVRWRLSRGIPTNAELTPEWLDEMFEGVRAGGLLALLPLEERMESYLARLRLGGEALPTRKEHGGPVLAIELVAREVGLNSANSLTPGAKAMLHEAAAATGVRLSHTVSKMDPLAGSATGFGSVTLTSGRLDLAFRPIGLLYRYQHHLQHDPIPFDPFPFGRSLAAVTKHLATAPRGRTGTIPPEQACYLINMALVWVLEFGPQIIELLECIRAEAKGKKPRTDFRFDLYRRVVATFERAGKFTYDQGGPWPVRESAEPDSSAHPRPLLRSVFLELLPAACVVIVAAFGARRVSEIYSLRADCVTEQDGGFWLETWISKTIRDLDRIPVPASVNVAVQMLHTLSATRRDRFGSSWLLDFDDPVPSPRHAFDLGRALKRFVELVNVPVLPNGQHWNFTPHQFRRFFGVVYYHHYRFPHLAALSHFFKHYDPDMTRVYISEVAGGGFLRTAEEVSARRRRDINRGEKSTERNRLADFQQEGLNFRLERYRRIIDGSDRASGFGGELLTAELNELVREFRTKVEIEKGDTSSIFDEMLSAFAADRRLEPNRAGHSYCKCTSKPRDLHAARCVLEASDRGHQLPSQPDQAFASDENCSGCPHNVQLPENENYWRKLAAESLLGGECALNEAYRALMLGRVALAEEHCARCFDAKGK